MSRICFLLLALFPASLSAQQLNKTISLRVVRQPVDSVLARISKAGGCSFSYVGKPFRADSLVTLTVHNKTIRQTLDQLFQGRMKYIESGDHIILQAADAPRERHYVISGYVRDRESGMNIANASVYDRSDLASAFTNTDGYFQLRLKDRGRQPSIQLTVSKDLYLDTNMYVMPGFDRELHVTIAPAKPVQLREFTVSDQVEKTWLGKRLLSQGLRRQTENISRFFANKPVQSSILPSVGSHGKMAGQVVNKFSLNILGGYSAGTDGVEIAGGFNINKKDAQYAQVAGIFNMVGGNVTGVQVGGIFNHNLKNVEGAQVAGIGNYSEGSMKGVQVGGIYNLMGDSVTGVQIGGIYNGSKGNVHGMQIAGIANMATGSAQGGQIAGITNLYRGSVNGVQISGIANITGRDFSGLQFSALYNHTGGILQGVQIGLLGNYSRVFRRGVQFGLVNVTDSSGGAGIGLVNIVRKNGYYKLSVFTSDLLPANLSFKSGRKQFYSILYAGVSDRLHSFGLGIGREFSLRNSRLAITTDLMQQNLFDRSWKSVGQAYRFIPQLHFKAAKWFSIQAGPVLSFAEYKEGFADHPWKGYPSFASGSTVSGWLGWQAGISFF